MEHEEFLLTNALEQKKVELEEYKVDAADRGRARDRDKEFIKIGKNNVRGEDLDNDAGHLMVGAPTLNAAGKP